MTRHGVLYFKYFPMDFKIPHSEKQLLTNSVCSIAYIFNIGKQ